MNVLRFIIENWDSVIIVLAFIGGAITLYARGETKVLSEILFRLVTEAERQFGIGTGELKHAAVLEWAYDKIPSILKLIITQKRLGEMIEEALAYAKTRWAKNPRLAGYIEEKPPDNT
jgi:hypothetical protein